MRQPCLGFVSEQRLLPAVAVVANEDGELDETVAQIEAILRAEKNKVSRRSLQQ